MVTRQRPPCTPLPHCGSSSCRRVCESEEEARLSLIAPSTRAGTRPRACLMHLCPCLAALRLALVRVVGRVVAHASAPLWQRVASRGLATHVHSTAYSCRMSTPDSALPASHAPGASVALLVACLVRLSSPSFDDGTLHLTSPAASWCRGAFRACVSRRRYAAALPVLSVTCYRGCISLLLSWRTQHGARIRDRGACVCDTHGFAGRGHTSIEISVLPLRPASRDCHEICIHPLYTYRVSEYENGTPFLTPTYLLL